jgi:RNA-directed DNA polymerase
MRLEADRTAGEGQGRTARMHVPEESDSGIVPMNHSNKDGRPSAESEEGRPLIKENTHQPTRSRHRAGQRVPGAGGCAESSKGKIRR